MLGWRVAAEKASRDQDFSQKRKQSMCAVKGKCPEEKPRACTGSYVKGISLRSEGELTQLSISFQQQAWHVPRPRGGRIGCSKGTSVDDIISWIHFVWDQREMWPVYEDPIPVLGEVGEEE